MKKENPLSVWTFSYSKRHYLTHPWKLFKDLYWNWRNFWHRARYGYAYVDTWNFCDWYPRVAAEALRYMEKKHCGYPGVKPWETPEKWSEYLTTLANRLERCANSQDILFNEERNEYAEEFHNAFKALPYHKEELPDGTVRTWHDETPEFIELREKYFDRSLELQKVDEAYVVDTYKMLAEDLGRLWD